MVKDNLVWREFRAPSSKSKDKIWKIAQDGNTFYTRHGIVDGAMQEFSDVPGAKGKEGTKAYVNEVDNCAFHISREIRKKMEHGYLEVIDGKVSEETITSISFDKYLPKNFCPCKPKSSIEPKNIEKLCKKGKARFSRKYDGMNHLAVHHTWGWEIYTRRMDLATERFPKHVEFLSTTSFGSGTILSGEMLCENENGTDNFKNISRICRSDPPEARKLVEDKEVPESTYQIFDILFSGGKSLEDTTYDNRRKLYDTINNDLVRAVKLEKVDHTNWESTAKSNGWEGYVLVDGESTPGSKFFSFNGEAGRPSGHSKCKPNYTTDAICFGATAGSGKRLNTVGAIFIKQRHPITKEFIFCGKCGSGMTEESTAELERLCKKHNLPIVEKDKEIEKVDIQNNNGFVVELEYGERQPGSNKFRFPVFMRIHGDKTPEECYAERLSESDEDES
jgi:ATP-dependent DNA ligase